MFHLAYFQHEARPFLIKFTDSFGIRYYGLAYLAGFLFAMWLLHIYTKKGRSVLTLSQQTDFLYALIIGVLVGGRLGYFLFYTPEVLLHKPLDFFKVWEGGMASHGGFFGVFLAALWIRRKHKILLLRTGDIVASFASAGLLFGRIANFMNGELWGKITTVPWAFTFPQSAPGLPHSQIPPRHPSQLYEAALEGFFLLIYAQLRFWKSDVTQKYPGQLLGEYIFIYSVVRIIGEQFREPDIGVTL
ncbi:MAG: prolipoprotein diacylglyceryl transferase, partial [Opitutaceae bacterium]|nr:prolipoprotein diacylglyceryl transferase [Opitutaceae bacterium]